VDLAAEAGGAEAATLGLVAVDLGVGALEAAVVPWVENGVRRAAEKGAALAHEAKVANAAVRPVPVVAVSSADLVEESKVQLVVAKPADRAAAQRRRGRK
jgi:hypothetical protein